MKPETRQDIARRLVAEAEGLVARQQALVAELAKGHHNMTLPLKLLGQFERARENFRRTLAALETFSH
jgi:hypothetical protein